MYLDRVGFFIRYVAVQFYFSPKSVLGLRHVLGSQAEEHQKKGGTALPAALVSRAGVTLTGSDPREGIQPVKKIRQFC